VIEGLAVGRIVHFTRDGESASAAIVTKVWSRETGSVNLSIFVEDDARPVVRETSVPYSESRGLRTWRFPPRDDD
jgi:hypothetical protein